MTFHLIQNPSSHSGKRRKMQRFWCERITKMHQGKVTITQTTGSGDAYRAAQESQADTIVAMGGDGTINEVLCGLFAPDRKATPYRFGVLYSGTSPDFCRFHGIPHNTPEEALETLMQGKAHAVDIVQLRYQSMSGKPTQSVFACSTNIGIGAATADFANRNRRYLGDLLGTALGLIRAIFQSHPFDLTLQYDNEASHKLTHVNHIILLKNPFIASGLRLPLERTPDDGLCSIILIQGKSRWGLLRLIPHFYGAKRLPQGLTEIVCRHATLQFDSPQQWEFDGDAQGCIKDLDMRLLPHALPLIVPHKSR